MLWTLWDAATQQFVLKTVRVVPVDKNAHLVLLDITFIRSSAKLAPKAVRRVAVHPSVPLVNRACTFLKEIVFLSAQMEHMDNLVSAQLAWMSAQLAKIVTLARLANLGSFVQKENVPLVHWDATFATVYNHVQLANLVSFLCTNSALLQREATKIMCFCLVFEERTEEKNLCLVFIVVHCSLFVKSIQNRLYY